jgi:hypothetical protein
MSGNYQKYGHNYTLKRKRIGKSDKSLEALDGKTLTCTLHKNQINERILIDPIFEN